MEHPWRLCKIMRQMHAGRVDWLKSTQPEEVELGVFGCREDLVR